MAIKLIFEDPGLNTPRVFLYYHKKISKKLFIYEQGRKSQ